LATEHRVTSNSLTNPRCINARANLDDGAAPLVAYLHRKLGMATMEISHIAIEKFNVGATDTNSLDRDEYIAGARSWVGEFYNSALLGTSDVKGAHNP
jgi:hypothetical protein